VEVPVVWHLANTSLFWIRQVSLGKTYSGGPSPESSSESSPESSAGILEQFMGGKNPVQDRLLSYRPASLL
jgi:hypothetical protein